MLNGRWLDIKRRFYPAIFAALAVFLVNVILEYIHYDLSLQIKVIFNIISAAIGAVLGFVLLKEKQNSYK